MTPDKLNELNQAELPARDLLVKLGYTYVPREDLAVERNDEREVHLMGRLRAALLRLNPWLTEQHAERVIFNLENVPAVGMARNQIIHEYLTYGMPLDVDEPGGRRTRIVAFFDFDHPSPEDGRNEFIVTTQMRVRRGRESGSQNEDDEKLVKPDLVLFVNGIPLVVMEAKAPTLLDVWRVKAIRQLLRYQEARPEWYGAGAPELFDYNLICVGHCGAAAVYGPVGAPENAYAEWKFLGPFTEEEARERFEVGAHGQAQLIIGLLAPATLLDILRDYVVYEPEQGRLVKKLPRYQQYRAVTAAVKRILRGARPEERGGVVWHTQGSGKSLTMLWLATKLRREPRLQNPTVVIVTDRTQLDQQITRTFERCGFPTPEHAANTRDLRKLLTSGTGRTVMTTIQKFEDALAAPDVGAQAAALGVGAQGLAPLRDPSEGVYVMVDEAHRTQYGRLGARMEQALPGATFIGFTGTPIDKGFRRSTMRRFGPLIDSYTIPQSVADGATVPIYYEARLPELAIQGPTTVDKLFETIFAEEPEEARERIKRKYANKETLAEAERRIEQIALDIAEHYRKRIKPNGFKAQVVAPSRAAAVRYAEKLNEFGVAAYPIITTSNDDGAEFKLARELDQGQVISSFLDPSGEAEMLVVVDMLLTGFDAPIEQALYLDREMREHGLLQAIARVNRPCTVDTDGVLTEKTLGLVVDYHGVSRELEAALASFERKDADEAWSPLLEDPAPLIESAAVQAESHFKGLNLDDTWACVASFANLDGDESGFKADRYERFNADYRAFSQLMDRYLPNPQALHYAERLTRLTKTRAYVRAQYLREDANVDWTAVSAKVKHLIDSRIDAQMRELMSPVSILDREFEDKIRLLPHDEARASVMEHAIRAQIKERIAENPVFYEKLSQHLARIIEDMRQKLIDAAEACQRLASLRLQLLSEADVAAQHGLSPMTFALYELLDQPSAEAQGAAPDVGAQGLAPLRADGAGQVREEEPSYRVSFDEAKKATAERIEAIIRHHQAIVDWQRRDDVQRAMRRDIKRELRAAGDLSEEELEEMARSMVEVARRRLA